MCSFFLVAVLPSLAYKSVGLHLATLKGVDSLPPYNTEKTHRRRQVGAGRVFLIAMRLLFALAVGLVAPAVGKSLSGQPALLPDASGNCPQGTCPQGTCPQGTCPGGSNEDGTNPGGTNEGGTNPGGSWNPNKMIVDSCMPDAAAPDCPMLPVCGCDPTDECQPSAECGGTGDGTPLPPASPPPPPPCFTSCTLEILSVRGPPVRGENLLQLGELYIQDSLGVEVKTAKATTTCSSSPGGEGPAMAFDEDPKSKFLCRSTPTKLTVALTPPAAVAAYDIRTANDFPARDPTSWTFSCDLEDGTNTVLGMATSHDPPDGRFALYGPFVAAPP